MNPRKINLIEHISVALVAGMLFPLNLVFSGSEIPPLSPQEVRFEQHLGNQLPLETPLIDELGQKKTLKSFTGRTPLILAFTYFRCPNLCTLVLNGLVQALKQLPDQIGRDYKVLAISIDPAEKPSLALAKKRTYLAKLGNLENSDQGESWSFLTSASQNDNDIHQLATSAGFHYYQEELSGEYAHPSGFLVVSPSGFISQYFFGIQFDPKKLHEALSQAKLERSGSWIEEVLLYCFHYDPKLSHNGPLIMTAIRIAGISAVFGIMLFYLMLYRSGRRDLKEGIEQ